MYKKNPFIIRFQKKISPQVGLEPTKWDKKWVLVWLSFSERERKVKLALIDFNTPQPEGMLVYSVNLLAFNIMFQKLFWPSTSVRIILKILGLQPRTINFFSRQVKTIFETYNIPNYVFDGLILQVENC